jgi:hypothetical protein
LLEVSVRYSCKFFSCNLTIRSDQRPLAGMDRNLKEYLRHAFYID